MGEEGKEMVFFGIRRPKGSGSERLISNVNCLGFEGCVEEVRWRGWFLELRWLSRLILGVGGLLMVGGLLGIWKLRGIGAEIPRLWLRLRLYIKGGSVKNAMWLIGWRR